jgi:hypothetical protein
MGESDFSDEHCCLHLQGLKIISACSDLLLNVLLSRIWRIYSPPKRRDISELHGVKTRKTVTFIFSSRPISGCSAEWTQLNSTPNYTNLKNNSFLSCHGDRLLMPIQFLGGYTLWVWAMLLIFRRYMLPPHAYPKVACTSETSGLCNHPRISVQGSPG